MNELVSEYQQYQEATLNVDEAHGEEDEQEYDHDLALYFTMSDLNNNCQYYLYYPTHCQKQSSKYY